MSISTPASEFAFAGRTSASSLAGPWMAALVRQYHAGQAPPAHPPRRRFAIVLTAMLAIGGLLLPALLHLDHAAYPNDPKRREALAACGRADPTFVRFFASDRAACYERFPGLAEPETVPNRD
jgi:hypothetical protein